MRAAIFIGLHERDRRRHIAIWIDFRKRLFVEIGILKCQLDMHRMRLAALIARYVNIV